MAATSAGASYYLDMFVALRIVIVFVSLCLYFYLNTRFLNDVMRKKIAIDKFKQ